MRHNLWMSHHQACCRVRLPHLRNLAFLKAAAILAGGFILPATSRAANITDLGTLGDPLTAASRYSYAKGVSADGLVIVGESDNGTAYRAFKYVGTTMTDLGALGDPLTAASRESKAWGISADGLVIVGVSDNGTRRHAFKYVGTTMTDLGALGDPLAATSHNSSATGVSADGSVIVGYSDIDTEAGTLRHALKVVGTTMTNLGALGDPLTAASRYSYATGVSTDGLVIVGGSDTDTEAGWMRHAFKYVGTTMTDLGALGDPLTAASRYSVANGVSADGSVIVGESDNGTLAHAFKVVGSTMTDLGALGDPLTAASRSSYAYGVSANGSVIVGCSYNGTATHAFKVVGTTMTDLGALGTNPSFNSSTATGISADGSVIVGYSDTDTNIDDSDVEHPFIYANDVMLDVVEWMASISGPAGILPIVESLSSMPLEGAHHRPLMSYDAMGKTRQSWVTGDFGSRSRKSDSHTTTGEAGVSGTYGDVVAGIAVGYGAQNNDLLFGGSRNVTGQYLLGEVDTRLADKQSILSLTAMIGSWKSDTLRGYAIGGGTDYSHGATDMKSASVRLRLDGPSMKFSVVPVFTPFASFTWGHTSADAYSETGGSFDAQFDKQTHNSQEGRIGLTSKYVLGMNTTLLATAEWIHRFDKTQSGFSGTDIDHGALPFSVAGAAITRDQARFGFDIDHKLSADTLLNVSMHFTGIGEAPDVSGAISIRRAF